MSAIASPSTAMTSEAVPIARFIPNPDIRERHSILVNAPGSIVLGCARELRIRSIVPMRAIFWARERILGAKHLREDASRGFLDDMTAIGWRVLAEDRDRWLIAGATCQPRLADVVFTPVPTASRTAARWRERRAAV